MATLSWLHLSDLHHGMAAQKTLWSMVRQQVFSDLERLHEQAGPWDLPR